MPDLAGGGWFEVRPDSILVVVGGERRLLEPIEVLDSLSAKKFIRPNLIDYGKAVVKDAKVYPPEVATYETRAKRGKSFGQSGKLGQFLKSATARGSQTKTARTAYQRTHHLYQSWRRATRGGNGPGALEEEIKNLAVYSGYVMGSKQPYTWRFGWRRLRKIMLDQMDDWIVMMEHKVQSLWMRKA